MITIVDYDAGNIRSIVNMLKALGVRSRISSDPAGIATADKLVLPGVGHFDYGMRQLAERGLVEALNRRVLGDGIPILGICLGAQLLTRSSEEGDLPGLGWLDARTVRFDRARLDPQLKVPHMGWADVWPTGDNPLLPAEPDDANVARFYHVHSFHIVCHNPAQQLMQARHGYDFATGIGRDNIVGVQFHPEKSHRFGMALLARFLAWQPGASGERRAA